MTHEELKAAVATCKVNLASAESALREFECLAENNVFATLDDAGVLEETLREQAFQDCQGAYNCGAEEYIQEFMVGDKRYVATLECEYNRHDKMYYYIEESGFSITEVV